MAYSRLELFVAGRWVSGEGRETEPVINPATEEVLGELPHPTPADIDEALAGAARGFEVWRQVSPYDRAKLLRKVADLMRERRDQLAPLITLEQGKPLAEARQEIANSADLIDWAAEEGRRAYGRLIPGRQPGYRNMVVHEPVGPVAAFGPWNVPAQSMVRKVASALAAGCSVIMKPAEETPGAPLAIARLFAEAGLPAGALSVIAGNPGQISERLLASEKIRKITFTGSTAIGKKLAAMASQTMKRMTLELGGHAPAIVFGDVDPEAVATGAVTAKYRNAGQICTSPTRFFVEERVFDRFVARFVELTRSIQVGNGLDPDTRMGPLANARRMEALQGFVDDAKARGIDIAAGGCRREGPGYFWQPTVFVRPGTDALASNVEPFGPLALITPFRDFDEAVALANRLPFGLAAYAFTNDQRRATALGAAVAAGSIAINHWQVSWPETPFGGLRDSGYGLEGGSEGLAAFMDTKFISQL